MKRFAEYLNSLRSEESEAYIELDKDKELAYMEVHKYRFEKVLDAIPISPNPIRILDIGTTPFTLFIKEANPHYEVTTIDLTNLLEARCKAKHIESRVCNLATQPIPFNDSHFDVVIFTEVFEHLPAPPTDIFREISRVLRTGGKLIFSTVNFATLVNRVKLLVGINPMSPADNQFKRGWVHGYGHVREYTMKEILCVLRSCNFTVSKKQLISATPSLRLIRNPYQLVAQTYRLACLLMPTFRSTIYVECYKRS